MEIKSYRDLIVWQKSMALVTDIYSVSASFPGIEKVGLTVQLRRSAVSIPSNIAEGYGRNSTADYMRFLRQAMGSLFEVQTQLEIALNLGYLKGEAYASIYEQSREIERLLKGLLDKISVTKKPD